MNTLHCWCCRCNGETITKFQVGLDFDAFIVLIWWVWMMEWWWWLESTLLDLIIILFLSLFCHLKWVRREWDDAVVATQSSRETRVHQMIRRKKHDEMMLQIHMYRYIVFYRLLRCYEYKMCFIFWWWLKQKFLHLVIYGT